MMQSKSEINAKRKDIGSSRLLDNHGSIDIASLVCVDCVTAASFGSCGGNEGLLEVADDVVDVLCAD